MFIVVGVVDVDARMGRSQGKAGPGSWGKINEVRVNVNIRNTDDDGVSIEAGRERPTSFKV